MIKREIRLKNWHGTDQEIVVKGRGRALYGQDREPAYLVGGGDRRRTSRRKEAY